MDRIASLERNLRGAALELAWGQWSASGLAGTQEISASVIDPEALLVVSMSLGRHDARLFDEVLDWLVKNVSLLDFARLRRILGSAPLSERSLIAAAARIVVERDVGANFGRLIAGLEGVTRESAGGQEDLFFSQKGQEASWSERDREFAAAGYLRPPVRLRGLSGRPRAANPACLRFRVRALVGQGSRAEVITYLITHDWTHGRLIAERTAYGQAPVAAYLTALQEAGLADRRDEGKKVLYRLSETLRDAFPVRALFVDWIRVWPAVAGLLDVLQPSELSEDASWIRLAQSLSEHEVALRAEGFEVEIGEVRGWAIEGPDVLVDSVEKVTARVIEMTR
jgi:DNA-binding transcriptional ArsR family regulator